MNEINMPAISDYLDEHRDEMIADLGAFVGREMPSEDKGLPDAFADYLAEYAKQGPGAHAAILTHGTAGNQVRVEWGEDEGRPPILLLGHYDTVGPAGTLEAMPLAVHGDTASGPGIFDIKCGLVQGFWGIKALREAAGADRHVVLLCNSDEELGSTRSRPLIEESATDSRTSLVLEPSLGGASKTSRKGESRFVVRAKRRAVHTGLDPEKGEPEVGRELAV